MKKSLALIAASSLALILTACAEDDTTTAAENATTTTAVQDTQTEDAATTDVEGTQPEEDQDEDQDDEDQAEDRAAGYESWLKEQFGVESFTEVLVSDPSSWAGYVNDFDANRDRMHVRLQVDRDSAEGEEMGEQAARAIANLIRSDDEDPRVAGVDWVVADDGAGVVIAQEPV